jgi:predicted TIM-barrel fold metal-dependent hydrolase
VSSLTPDHPRGPGVSHGKHYVVISSDGHAGAPIREYKQYLEQRWHDDFDAWAAAFADPWADLEEDSDHKPGVASADSTFSWDSAKRQAALESDGIVGEVLFPNTAPPFFPAGVFTVAAPTTRDEYERRWAGLRAHNRWLVDFCAEAPGRRAGCAQVFLNDVDDTMAEIRWLKEAGLTGGILLPGDAPSQLVPLYYPAYDPIWALCEELEVPVHRHANLPGEAAGPAVGPAGPAVGILESHFFAHRALGHLIFAGVFERFPRLRFVVTEAGTGWAPSHLRKLDEFYEAGLVKGSVNAYFLEESVNALTRRPSEYFATNVWIGASFLTAPEAAKRTAIGVDRIMWGADLPHLEGTYPFSREAIRAALCDVPPDEVAAILGTTAAEIYSFDLAALQPVADRLGPTVEEVATPLIDPPSFPDVTATAPLNPALMTRSR